MRQRFHLILCKIRGHSCGLLLLCISLSSVAQLPTFKATVYQPSSTGYYFFSAFYTPVNTFFILDKNGDVVYYKTLLPGANAYNFQLQPNGQMSYSNLQQYFLMDSTFRITDSVSCKNMRYTDQHELRILPNGHFLLLGADSVMTDLSKYPYGKTMYDTVPVLVRWEAIQELDEKRNVVFEWHAKDHFQLEDIDTYFLHKTPQFVSWTHSNELEMDWDGNILLSTRNFNEVTKINRTTGKIMWRLGGKHNEFKFINCPVPFYAQHDIRRISNGHITLFDGGHNVISHGARALEFELDEQKKMATLKWSYVYDSTLSSKARGNVQRLNNSNTLVNYGRLDTADVCFVVVDSLGYKVFELNSADHMDPYRVLNYATLPWQITRPQVNCFDSLGVTYLDAGAGHLSYRWNTGDSTRIIPVKLSGDYFVYVPYGEGAFISSEKINVTDAKNCCKQLRLLNGKQNE